MIEPMRSGYSKEKWTIGWGYTSLCDLECRFCYSSKVRNEQGSRSEISLESAENFLGNNGDSIQAINFGTGECSLSPEFPELLQLCRDRLPEVEIALTTNGALASRPKRVRDSILDFLSECDVSLDFADEKEYDRWRGKSGVWRRAIETIKHAKSSDIDTTIVMVGTSQTLKRRNLEGLMNIACNLKVPLRINMYMPTTGDFSFAPSVDMIWSSIETLGELSKSISSSDPLFSVFIDKPFRRKNNHSCRILPGGGITPSTYLISDPWVVEGSINEYRLSDLPSTKPFQMYGAFAIPPQCEECPLVSECQGGSPERRWLWTGKMNSLDPFCPFVIKSYKQSQYPRRTTSIDDVWNGPNIHLDYLPTIVVIPAC